MFGLSGQSCQSDKDMGFSQETEAAYLLRRLRLVSTPCMQTANHRHCNYTSEGPYVTAILTLHYRQWDAFARPLGTRLQGEQFK